MTGVMLTWKLLADRTISREFRGKIVSWTIPAGTEFVLPAGMYPRSEAELVRRVVVEEQMVA